jgi:hypothetical protein
MAQEKLNEMKKLLEKKDEDWCPFYNQWIVFLESSFGIMVPNFST